MKNLKIAELVAVGMMSMLGVSSTVLAQSNDVKGGGEVINRNGYRELRDLLEHSSCDWQTGTEVFDSIEDVKQILSSVAKIDWYFANVLEREIKRLNWCFTGKLVKVNTEDRDSIMTPVTLNSERAAIRMLDSTEVYLDAEIFKSLKGRSKAFLVLHEALHSFLTLKTSMRNEKLRSTVKIILKVPTQEITTRNDLYKALKRNEIQYPSQTELLDEIKDYVLSILGSESDKIELLKRINSVETLTPNDDQLRRAMAGLLRADQYSIRNHQNVDLVSLVCSSKNKAKIDSIILNPDLNENVLAYCFGSAGNDLSSRKQMIQLPLFKTLIGHVFQSLQDKKILKGEFLLYGSSGTNALSTSSVVGRPEVITAMTPVSQGSWDSLNPMGKVIYQYVKTLIELEQWSELEKMFDQAKTFNDIFSLKKLEQEVSMVETKILREKKLAIDILTLQASQYWTTFMDVLTAEVGVSSAKKFETIKNK